VSTASKSPAPSRRVTKLLIRDLAQAVSPAGTHAPIRGREAMRSVDVVEDAFILCEDGRISAVGRMRSLDPLDGDVEELDGSGCAAIPGLVDCHTHASRGFPAEVRASEGPPAQELYARRRDPVHGPGDACGRCGGPRRRSRLTARGCRLGTTTLSEVRLR
jgi:hypothetical protein